MIRVPLDAWCGLLDVLGVRDGLGVADDAGVVDGGLVRRSSAEDVDASPDAHAALRAHTRTTTGRTRLRVDSTDAPVFGHGACNAPRGGQH
jgi:hypothetical protein